MYVRWTLPLISLFAGLLAGYWIGMGSVDKPAGNSPEKPGRPSSQPVLSSAAPSKEHEPSADLSESLQESAANQDPDTEFVPLPLSLPGRNLTDSYLLLEEDQNLVGIIDLILALVQQKRFAEADALIESTLEGLNGGKLNSPLWKNSVSPSFMILRFCQNPQNYLAAVEYAVHLSQLNPSPELLTDIRDEILMGETATQFLGLNDGIADHVVGDLVPYYRERIENWNRTTWTNRPVIQNLGLIPTDESAFLMADLREWSSSNLELELIQGLANNGTPTAIEVMVAWLAEARNPRFILALKDALRLLGH